MSIPFLRRLAKRSRPSTLTDPRQNDPDRTFSDAHARRPRNGFGVGAEWRREGGLMFAAENTDAAFLAPASSVRIRLTSNPDGSQQSEIRLRWSAGICHFGHEIQAYAIWCAATPWLHRDFELMVAIANEVYGDDSHWIEERPAAQSPYMHPASEQPQG